MQIPTLRRCVDITAAGAGLVAASPFLALMVAVARYESGDTGMFYQQRHGLHGQPFWIWKIRTLDKDMKKLRVTGALRSIGLDELPQMVNILKGDMSIFGPRPYTRIFTAKGWARRLDIAPGLIEPGTIAAKEMGACAQSDALIAMTTAYVDKRLNGQWCMAADLAVAWRTMKLMASRRVDGNNDHTASAIITASLPAVRRPAPATFSQTGISGPV